MSSNTKKHVLVTGGSSGIGAETIKHFAEKGYVTHLVYFKGEDRAREIQEELRQKGNEVEIYQADLSNEKSVSDLFKMIGNNTSTLDVLIHSAVHEIPKPVDIAEFSEWRSVIGSKLDSAFLTIQEFLPFAKQSSNPSIVLITSIDGEKPDGEYIAYQVSTAGLIAMTKALSVYLAKKYNIRVNAVSPGPTPTPLWQIAGETPEMWEEFNKKTPIGRVANTHDVAKACYYLATDEDKFLNGVFLDVDGGLRWT